ncbi:MAG: NusG domain II-containing protein [Spirochaetales bacterium]|nr:NusG domain II-containing protein [Spirochaetales bacterium]
MERRRSPVKPLDLLIVAFAVLATALGAVSALGAAGAPRVIVSDGDNEWIYPLDTDRSLPVEGPLGVTLVVIEDGAVHVHESPCGNQTCVAAGTIERPGQWVACLPNKVFVRVDSGGEEAQSVDADSW